MRNKGRRTLFTGFHGTSDNRKCGHTTEFQVYQEYMYVLYVRRNNDGPNMRLPEAEDRLP